jgi:hypothetical protein
MEYGAIDLHLRQSHIRIVREDGTVVVERRIPTTRASLVGLFGGRARLRVLLESGTESEWVAQTLEACGHEVIVADPNYALMYGHRGGPTGENGSAGCDGAGGGLSARHLSPGAPGVGGATAATA